MLESHAVARQKSSGTVNRWRRIVIADKFEPARVPAARKPRFASFDCVYAFECWKVMPSHVKNRPGPHKTRNAAAVWLIGCGTPSICGENKLPVLRSVLQHVIFLHGAGNGKCMKIRDACRHAVEKLVDIWGRAGIPTLQIKDATDNLVTRFNEWTLLKKARNKPATERREKFIAMLDKLFDIGPPDAMKRIKLEEDKLFYKSMQEDRVATMASVDRKWVRTKVAKLKRLQGHAKLKRRSSAETQALFRKTSHDADADAIDEPSESEEKDTGMFYY